MTKTWAQTFVQVCLLNESQQAGSADVALPWFANFIGADVEMMAPAWRCVWFLWVLPLAALRPERETEDLDAKHEGKQSISSIRAALENLQATESYILRRFMPVRREKWAADAVPNPMSNPLQCGLHAPGFLCDPDHLLTENERLKVEEALVAIHEDTQLLCPDGTNHSYQAGVLVVATVSSSESLGWWNKETMAEAFAKKVQDAWGVGDAGCDNGVVLLISVGDGLFYIKTAEKAREVLTDRTAGRIADNVRPHLKNGRVGEAILLGCSDIRLALRGNIFGMANRQSLRRWRVATLTALAVAVILMVAVPLWHLSFVSVHSILSSEGAQGTRGTRSRSSIQRHALKRLTKKEKVMRTISQVRERGVGQLTNRLMKKQLKRVSKIAEDDAWVNEFLSFSRPMPVGGEFIMPPEVAKVALEEIYGEGPDLQHIDLEELEETEAPSKDEVKDLERLRRKVDFSKSPGAGKKTTRVGWTSIPGVQRFVGSVPQEIATGLRGNVGGSVSDQGYQDVWISGGSVYFSWFDCFLIVSAGIFFCMNLPQILSGFFMFLVLVLGLLLYPFAKLADATNWCWWKIRTHGIKEDLERIQKELEKDEFSQSLCPICLENFCDAGSDPGVRKLECKHGFHAACIDNWLRESESCPFCRFVDLRLSDDQRKAERGQRRLRFYLSRLSARYPGSTFDSTGSRPLFVSSSSWAQSLNTSLRSAMVTSTQIGAIGPGASGGRFAGGGW
eukprot:symbB.v1.2.031091.t2/scaffold3571.1/size58269/4